MVQTLRRSPRHDHGHKDAHPRAAVATTVSVPPEMALTLEHFVQGDLESQKPYQIARVSRDIANTATELPSDLCLRNPDAISSRCGVSARSQRQLRGWTPSRMLPATIFQCQQRERCRHNRVSHILKHSTMHAEGWSGSV